MFFLSSTLGSMMARAIATKEFVAGLKEDDQIREKVDCCTIQQMWLLSYYEKLIRYVVRR